MGLLGPLFSKNFPYYFSFAVGSLKDGRDLLLYDQVDLQTYSSPVFLKTPCWSK